MYWVQDEAKKSLIFMSIFFILKKSHLINIIINFCKDLYDIKHVSFGFIVFNYKEKKIKKIEIMTLIFCSIYVHSNFNKA